MDESFLALAEQRWAEIIATGDVISWGDAKARLEARLGVETPERPSTRAIRGQRERGFTDPTP